MTWIKHPLAASFNAMTYYNNVKIAQLPVARQATKADKEQRQLQFLPADNAPMDT